MDAGIQNMMSLAQQQLQAKAPGRVGACQSGNQMTSSGSIVAWGDDSSGQIDVPTGLTNVTAIAAGWSHSLALNGNGTVVAWGGSVRD